MSSAYSFESDLSFRDAVTMLDAVEDWVRQPNLENRWLIRDSDRLGDYLSWYAPDRIESGIVRTVCLYFDTKPRQITFGVSNREIPASREGLERALTEHRAYILNELLPRIGARNVQSSDFER